jgi:YVTN family beta-propeller protein
MAGLVSWLMGSILTGNVYGAFGDVVKTYTFPASAFLESPTQPIIYATIPSQNAVAIINTNTLSYETAFVGSGPLNLALSPDGLTAYIANSTSSFVAVFDTQSRTVINSLLIPEQPQDVVLGNQNRLFVLTASHIYQIDATTGASTGPSIKLDRTAAISRSVTMAIRSAIQTGPRTRSQNTEPAISRTWALSIRARTLWRWVLALMI